MPEPKVVAGSCLCGRVQYEATGPFPTFRYCHCERCQKSTGSAHSGGPVPKLQRDGKHVMLPGGTLETDPGVRPIANIFWKLRAPWFVASSELPNHDARPAS